MGRVAGTPNKKTQELRDLMEAHCGGEPVPLLLLKLGLKYHDEGKADLAIRAISDACRYGYPSLKAIEMSGAVAQIPAPIEPGPSPVDQALSLGAA
jgi:hypothetical protein